MAEIYLHEHKDFPDLLRIIEEEKGILAGLVEKDYWIMHALYGLKKQGYKFQLKGGTSLSKGFGLIDRFSEDIDIHIDPPAALGINENPKNSSEKNIQKKKQYYDTLAGEIKIDGIINVKRDTAFDTNKYNSGGIRLADHFAFSTLTSRVAVRRATVISRATVAIHRTAGRTDRDILESVALSAAPARFPVGQISVEPVVFLCIF